MDFNFANNILGYWWLPENPSNKLPGVLHKEGSNTKLEVLGSFDEEILSLDFQKISVIHGSSLEEAAITLTDCLQINSSLGNICKNIYKVTGSIYQGIHADTNKPTFNEIQFKIDNLDNWINLNGLNIQRSNNTNSDKNFFNLSYEFPEKIAFKINDAIISIVPHFYTSAKSTFDYNLKQEHWTKIQFKEKIPFELIYSNYVRPLQAFFIFSMGDFCNVHEPILYNNDDNKSKQVKSSFPMYSHDSKTITCDDMLFSYKDINSRLETVLQIWFDKYTEIKLALDLFINIENYHYLEHKFFSTVQALEDFHRRFYKEYEQDPKDYKKRVEYIIKCIENKEDKNFVKNILKYSNKPSLKNRLKELIPDENVFFSQLIEQRSKFLNDVVNLRNDIAHTTQSHIPNQKVQEVWEQTLILFIVLKIHLLLSLGFDEKSAYDLVKNDWRYRSLMVNN